MKNNNDTIITISWTRQDIRDLLFNDRQLVSEKDIDDFLSRFDLKYFEEQCIYDGWERLQSAYQKNA